MSASRPGRFNTREKTGTQRIGAGRAPEPVCMRGRREKFSASDGNRTPVIQSIA